MVTWTIEAPCETAQLFNVVHLEIALGKDCLVLFHELQLQFVQLFRRSGTGVNGGLGAASWCRS